MFTPFDGSVWVCIFVFLSILGLIMLFFEYDAPGSAYPKEIKSFSRSDNGKGEPVMEMRKIPIYKYFIKSVYRGILAFFEQAYSQSVYTAEGKVLLVGISFFIMMIIALYTANIAAILTTSIQDSSIKNLREAINQGYNFCAYRKTVKKMKILYNMDEKLFVPDPVDLGGDGKPGFACLNCNARSRVFDFIRSKHNNRSSYCNAAISYDEDLEILQNSAKHCDVIRVGDSLASSPFGLPISAKDFPALSTLFNKLKIEDYVSQLYKKEKPESLCNYSADEELNALTFNQLSGLWTVCAGFILVAFLVKIFRGIYVKRNPGRKQDFERFNQWGEPSSHEVIIDGHIYDIDEDNLSQSDTSLTRKEVDDKEVRAHNANSSNGLRRRNEKEVPSHNENLTNSRCNDFGRQPSTLGYF